MILNAAGDIVRRVSPGRSPSAGGSVVPLGAPASFLSTLSFETLRHLRQIVKRIHMRHYPNDKCTDREADRIIEAAGRQYCDRWLEDAKRDRSIALTGRRVRLD